MTLNARPKHAVPQATNAMKKTIEAILERQPTRTENRSAWDHFAHSCAYCGCDLAADARDWHWDHIDPVGGNHIGNRAPACGRCNGDQKLALNWEEFLATKAEGDAYTARRERITKWMDQHPRPSATHSQSVEKMVEELRTLVAQFGAKCRDLKATIASEDPQKNRPRRRAM